MTHDELLAKINEELSIDYADAYGNFPIGLNALRAVVELHKPKSYAESSNTCSHCIVYYPCETIQAIEKKIQ